MPAEGEIVGTVQLMHGNTMNFYVEFETLDAGGHYYSGGEDLVAGTITRWLADRIR